VLLKREEEMRATAFVAILQSTGHVGVSATRLSADFDHAGQPRRAAGSTQ
jgi:hypothetical protein